MQTSFMFLTIGLVPMLVSTVAFLPKTRVPWPLPVDYGKRRHQSLDENLLRKQRAWQRRLSGKDAQLLYLVSYYIIISINILLLRLDMVVLLVLKLTIA